MSGPRRSRYLQALGIPEWSLRSPASDAGPPAFVTGPAATEGPVGVRQAARPGTDRQAADWNALEAEVAACTACALHATRTQTVFGVGRRDADLLVIGEAPGADEDRQGEPFVGRAGQLLNAMLRGIGFSRSDVYIANILKCRPPQNRDPKPEEQRTCAPFLQRQLALLEPRVILAVGRVSAQWLLDSDSPIGRLRGRVHTHGHSQIPVVVTYHPAYLLRSPEAKSKSWQDLLLVREVLANVP